MNWTLASATDCGVLSVQRKNLRTRDLTAQPGYDEILASRADRMAVMRRIVTSTSLVAGGRV